MEPAYTPSEDIHGKTEDGRDYLIAAKGVPIEMEQARRLGLIKDHLTPGPSEHKQIVGPGETKDGALAAPAGGLPTPTDAETTAIEDEGEGEGAFTPSQPLVDAVAAEKASTDEAVSLGAAAEFDGNGILTSVSDVALSDVAPEGEQPAKVNSRKAKVEKAEE